MIGVIAKPEDREVVQEFFELFKTPWEFYRSGQNYGVIICTEEEPINADTRLILVYSGDRTRFDEKRSVLTGQQRTDPCVLLYKGDRIPIYGASVPLSSLGTTILADELGQGAGGYLGQGDTTLVRIGYDLFTEIRILLTSGQPAANAHIPAIELHIAILRDLIIKAGIVLVEIPPAPVGYQFVVCLTHDVDHPSVRAHKFDHTTCGFLYRALFGSVRKVITGRMSIRDLITNWIAAAKLPFVHLHLADDFWSGFADQYLELEKGLTSTFFFIPFRENPGKTLTDYALSRRGARYSASDFAATIEKLMAHGCEVGLHGIDAWVDVARGGEEFEKIRQLSRADHIGVRMHWLYYDKDSPALLEAAGANYDSTVGYNQTVGYRAGTTQAFKPLNATRLLELPLHLMDTALFYPSYLNLSPSEAKQLMIKMADNATRFGGTLTINWHDRSLAPERLWSECYREFLQELRGREAWFATAGQATAWFRKRRGATFDGDAGGKKPVRAGVSVENDGLPGLRIRTHKASNGPVTGSPENYIDVIANEPIETVFISRTAQ